MADLSRSKDGHFSRWFKDYAATLAQIVQTILIAVASVVAICQLRDGNQQARVANTLAFLNQMQTREFHDDYREAILWMVDACEKPPDQRSCPPGVQKQVNHVLGLYSSLGVLYGKKVLDRETFEAAAGARIVQFWRNAEEAMAPPKLEGFKELGPFVEVLEKSPVIMEQLEKNPVIKERNGAK